MKDVKFREQLKHSLGNISQKIIYFYRIVCFHYFERDCIHNTLIIGLLIDYRAIKNNINIMRNEFLLKLNQLKIYCLFIYFKK